MRWALGIVSAHKNESIICHIHVIGTSARKYVVLGLKSGNFRATKMRTKTRFPKVETLANETQKHKTAGSYYERK